jgi:hypothetical protein
VRRLTAAHGSTDTINKEGTMFVHAEPRRVLCKDGLLRKDDGVIPLAAASRSEAKAADRTLAR